MRGRLISSTAGVVLLAAAGQAWAADPDANQIEEVVVTAQHRSENLQEVPITIQAFSGEALQDLGVKSTADLGQFTPNVSIITRTSSSAGVTRRSRPPPTIARG